MGDAASVVVAYAQPDKAKSRRVLEAFAAGCGGKMASTTARELEPGDCAFYGIRPAWLHLWRQAQAEGRNWYYLDNSFFDADREQRFRVCRNGVQQTEFRPAGRREVSPWRKSGSYILICPQSDEFMATVAGWRGDWTAWAATEVRRCTTRPVRVRRKGSRVPLAAELAGAGVVVVHSSAIANEALLAGIPIFATGACAASQMGLSGLSRIEAPLYPDGRAEWAAAVAAAQWSLAELADGTCWREMHA